MNYHAKVGGCGWEEKEGGLEERSRRPNRGRKAMPYSGRGRHAKRAGFIP